MSAVLHCYVDDDTLATLERVSTATGCSIEDLAVAVISEAAIQAKVAAMYGEPKGPSMTNPLGEEAVKHNAVLHAHEALTTLCEWLGQREAGQPATNSEAALFARCSQAADYLDAALGLALDTRPPQPQGACVQVEGLIERLAALEARAEREWLDKWPDDLGRGPYAPALEEAGDAISKLSDRLAQGEAERDTARATLAHLLDQATYSDSYGVHGSDFTVCRFCEGGGAPNVAMEHKPDCPVAMNADVVAEWFAEMEDNRTETLAALHQRDAASKALEEAEQAITNWFAPWGAWKTAWWEGFASDNTEYAAENFLAVLGNRVRQALSDLKEMGDV